MSKEETTRHLNNNESTWPTWKNVKKSKIKGIFAFKPLHVTWKSHVEQLHICDNFVEKVYWKLTDLENYLHVTQCGYLLYVAWAYATSNIAQCLQIKTGDARNIIVL